MTWEVMGLLSLDPLDALAAGKGVQTTRGTEAPSIDMTTPVT